MNYLSQGIESEERLSVIIRATGIRSEAIIAALHDHYCKGFSDEMAAAMNVVTQSNLKRAAKRLNEMAGIIEEVKDIDWRKFKSVKCSCSCNHKSD